MSESHQAPSTTEAELLTCCGNCTRGAKHGGGDITTPRHASNPALLFRHGPRRIRWESHRIPSFFPEVTDHRAFGEVVKRNTEKGHARTTTIRLELSQPGGRHVGIQPECREPGSRSWAPRADLSIAQPSPVCSHFWPVDYVARYDTNPGPMRRLVPGFSRLHCITFRLDAFGYATQNR